LIWITQVKFFPFNLLGNVSKEEFLRAINKIGITGFSDKNLLDVFDIYDVDGSGELDYKEFVGGIYSNNSISRKGDAQAKVEVVQQENRGTKKVFLEQAE
jgi:Ca2+-binding EF-hand superfamily protein